MAVQFTTLEALCSYCRARMHALGLTGKRRDDAALHFFTGASIALYEAKHPDAPHVAQVLAMILAPRGYREVERILDNMPAEAQPKEKTVEA